jgi:hypothetical protein
MPEPVSLLMLQFLDWVARRPRTYAEAIDAWRTSCPRLSVWEDALIDGLVQAEGDGPGQPAAVTLTPRGRAALDGGRANEPARTGQALAADLVRPAGAPGPGETLHEVTEVAVIRHPQRGALLLHSPTRRWHFPDATVRVHESWEQSLRRGVEAATGITDLVVSSVLRVQNFAPGTVHERAQYGVFFLCTTGASLIRLGAGDDQWCWVKQRDELARLELFHRLVEELAVQALGLPMPAEPLQGPRGGGPP